MSKFIPSANDDHLIMVTAQPQKGWIRPAVNTFMIMLIFMQWHKQQVCKYIHQETDTLYDYPNPCTGLDT